MPTRIRIIHVINSFTHGGAEEMLSNLLLRTDRERFDPSVAMLIDDRTVAGPITAAGIPLKAIGMKPGIPDPRGLWRLARHIRTERPHIVQTWMDHSNLIGGLAAWLATRTRVVWGIHHSNHIAGLSKRTTLMTVSVCAKLSARLPAKIIYCSKESRRLYELRGFSPKHALDIPNGFDTARFRPDPVARAEVRQELGIGPETQVVGLIARYDPIKDHANFLKAASLLAARMPNVRFVLCGSLVDQNNVALVRAAADLGVLDRCHLLGARADIARIYSALDLSASSSVTEAFPLAVGEAMASGIPCVATDVGDSARIIGPAGTIVPPQNSLALTDGMHRMLSMSHDERTTIGLQARSRICEFFDLRSVTRRYEQCYFGLLNLEQRNVDQPSGGNDEHVQCRLVLPAKPGCAASEVKCE